MNIRRGLVYFTGLLIVVLSGCGYTSQLQVEQVILRVNSQKTTMKRPNQNQNKFFKAGKDFTYKIKYSEDEGCAEERMKFDMVKVKTFEKGTLYCLNTKKDITPKRFPIYLYVQKDKIFRVWKKISDVDEIKNEKDFLSESIIVYQSTPIVDALGEDAEGVHHYVDKENSKGIVESHYYECNDKGNITGYWENFQWQKGKGLVKYKSGYNAEANLVEMQRCNKKG